MAGVLDSLRDSGDILRRFEISADSKQEIRNQLHALGIRRSSLFPDLTNLSHELKELSFPVS